MTGHTSIHLSMSSVVETEKLAAAVGALLKAGDLLALTGGLGAGKSVFARAVIRALLRDPDVEVPSPTFTLIQTYEHDTLEVWHADLYRLEDPDEIYELGLDDMRAHIISLVEWPEKLPAGWLEDALTVTIEDSGEAGARTLKLTGNARWQNRLAGLDVTAYD